MLVGKNENFEKAQDTSGFDRDETQLNHQDSDSNPIGFALFGKS